MMKRDVENQISGRLGLRDFCGEIIATLSLSLSLSLLKPLLSDRPNNLDGVNCMKTRLKSVLS